MVGVEPELAADARDSFRRGEPVAWPAADVQRTIADALRVERVGALPFAHIRELVTDIDHGDRGRDARRGQAARAAGQAGRGAGRGGRGGGLPVPLRELPQARTPVAVLSGGNIDPELLARILAPD